MSRLALVWVLPIAGCITVQSTDDKGSDAESVGRADGGGEGGAADGAVEAIVDASLSADTICRIDYSLPGGARSLRCEIPVDSLASCDELSRCVCVERTPSDGDVEGCVRVLVAPRGAITFSDLCPRSGEAGAMSIAEMLSGEGQRPVEMLMGVERTQVSSACADLPALTNWDEPPG